MPEPDAPISARSFLSETDLPLLWEPGDTILDLYDVKKRIESGGMAVVYQVHHRTWNLDLAVKTPRSEIVGTADGLATFIAEAEAWVDLGLHPHIVSCHYVRKLGVEAVPRVFAEWVPGGSLLDWIHKGKAPAIPQQLDLAIQFAWGLAYAHEKGLVHKDVKPENVLLTEDGALKVTDFGLAGARGNYYTPPYASPEQVMAQGTTFKTDIWSWAVAVLHLLLGERTWQDGTIAGDVLENALQNRLQLPPGLYDLLGECFRDDPDERPESMAAVAERLTHIYIRMSGTAYPRELPKAADLRADSLNNKALSLLDLDQPIAAESVWQDALAADPRHIEATYNLGLRRWRSVKQTDIEAVEQLRTAIASRLDDWRGWLLLARLHIERGDPDGADAASLEAERLAPEEPDLLVTLKQMGRIQAGRCLRTFEGHESFVRTVAITPDGRLVLSGGWDKTLRLWTLGGELVRTFRGHEHWIEHVAIAPDGQSALSCGHEGTIFKWVFNRSEPVARLEGHSGRVNTLAYSPDGRLAVSGGRDDFYCLWDPVREECREKLERPFMRRTTALAFLPDGSSYLSSLKDVLTRWDLESGERSASLAGHEGEISAIAVTPNGQQALTSSLDMTIRHWDLETSTCLNVIRGHTHEVTCVAVSPDGRSILSTGRDGTVRLWDLETGFCRRTFQGHADRVDAVACTPDGRWVVSASSDGTLRLWGLEGIGQEQAAWALSRPTMSTQAQRAAAAFEKELAVAQDELAAGEVRAAAGRIRQARSIPGFELDLRLMDLWHAAGIRGGVRTGLLADRLVFEQKAHEKGKISIDISRDGRFAITAGEDKTLRVWDLPSGENTRTLKGHRSWILDAALSPDGQGAVLAMDDKTIVFWDLEQGKQVGRAFRGHKKFVNAVAFTPDGRWIVSGGYDNTMRLWDLETRKCLHVFDEHPSFVTHVTVTPEGRRAVAVCWHESLYLWDLESGACLQTYTGHDFPPTCAAITPDGRQLVSGSEDNTLKLWDLETGVCLQTCRGHTSILTAVAVLPDGRYALSGSRDTTVKLWDVGNGECLRTFESHRDEVNDLAIAPDGRSFLSSSKDGSLCCWALDWDFEFPEQAAWDPAAQPLLDIFLTQHTPFSGDRSGSDRAPNWTEEDFRILLNTLGCAGYGWLRTEDVREQLAKLASAQNN